MTADERAMNIEDDGLTRVASKRAKLLTTYCQLQAQDNGQAGAFISSVARPRGQVILASSDAASGQALSDAETLELLTREVEARTQRGGPRDDRANESVKRGVALARAAARAEATVQVGMP